MLRNQPDPLRAFSVNDSQGRPLKTSSGAPIIVSLLPVTTFTPVYAWPRSTASVLSTRILTTSKGVPLRTAKGAPLFWVPAPVYQFSISGVTRDSSGNPLPGCSVALYETVGDQLVDRVVSDASGNYRFVTAGPTEAYYVVAYLAGSPDVAGTTVNTLIGT